MTAAHVRRAIVVPVLAVRAPGDLVVRAGRMTAVRAGSVVSMIVARVGMIAALMVRRSNPLR
jgi:hypothetical protein